jgi:hypothetical protein
MNPISLVLIAGLIAGAAEPQHLALRRIALVVATNDGGKERETLRYAETDAQAFGALLEELGGVENRDRVLLIGPNQAQFEDQFREIELRIQSAKKEVERVELIFYYSGHSDEHGLLLGDFIVPYSELRAKLETLSADVRIAILDSCASGAMTRHKGGALRPPFMVDRSTQVKGFAVLTSSSENEVAQESDRLGASFFTNYLIAGLRGAADVTGDGRVTLNEAYQFAFQETLARTKQTIAGAQHPAYSIQLVGSGDLVMTDIRSTGAALMLDAELEGRVDIRDTAGRLIAELQKRSGQVLELGMAAGEYDVLLVHENRRRGGRVSLQHGGRTGVSAKDLTAVDGERTTSRGSLETAEYAWVPFDFGLLPMWSIAGIETSPVETNFALSLLMSESARLSGAAITAGASLVSESMDGFQLSAVANIVGGNARGIQLSGAVNTAGDFSGFQLGGAFNYAGDFRGFQLSGALNYAEQFDGFQLGVINIGARVRGVQLGVINISENMSGFPLGLVNYSTSDGILSATAFTSDVGLISAGLRIGTHNFYSLFVASGGMLSKADGWAAGIGLGGRVYFDTWYLDIDSIVYSARRTREIGDESLIDSTRILAGYRFSEDFAIYAGPSFNVSVIIDEILPENRLAPKYAWSAGDRVDLWIGGAVGIELF